MYAYVFNHFKEINPIDGTIPKFIKVEDIDELYLYQFIQTLLLLCNENPYDVNSTLDLNAVQNANISYISSSINNLIAKFNFLGTIGFTIDTKDYDMFIIMDIVLNKPIKGKTVYKMEVPLQNRDHYKREAFSL